MESDTIEPGSIGGAAQSGDGGGSAFFKKKSKKNVRRRSGNADEEEESNNAGSAVVRKTKVAKKGDLEFSTGAGAEARGTEEAPKIGFTYESNRQVQTINDSRATAVLETETSFDHDARAIREKVLKNAEAALNGNKVDDKLYRGQAGYTDHTAGFRREHTVGGDKASGAHGPLRASAHIRWSVRFDYQPDICKDYKETGYCGYGDACKFMHDRGDYKSGWQLEKEWDGKEKRRKEMVTRGITEENEAHEGESDSDDEKGLPFACYICRQPFTDPVATRCKHYFCEHCALKHNSKNKNCFVCNKPTNGVFNTAHEIIKKMKEDLKEETGQEKLTERDSP